MAIISRIGTGLRRISAYSTGRHNLYSLTKGQQAIRELAGAMVDRTGNLATMPGIFPDHAAPIVRNGPAARELVLARWGMPTPAFALRGRNSDSGITNVRNVASPHWRRCLVPLTNFSENETLPDGSHTPVWLALGIDRQVAFFAGIWTNPSQGDTGCPHYAGRTGPLDDSSYSRCASPAASPSGRRGADCFLRREDR